ncbi:MAG: uracil-DNA glycosylase [Candidatus Nitrosotenuis sp.]
MKDIEKSLNCVANKVIKCKKCPRLASYIREVARVKVKRFSHEIYWGRPLPGFGDPDAQILIVGLAPAAHGGNRTGRMFTGDSSGDWLARVLFDNGLATKPVSLHPNDGFRLINSYITAAVRCAPPKNKPTKDEIDTCMSYLKQELELLIKVKVIVCLGRIAFNAVCDILDIKTKKFTHGQQIRHSRFIILCSYHPSRQNTQTRRLQWPQWNEIFLEAKKLLKL